MLIRNALLVVFSAMSMVLLAQYPPAAEQVGTTAIHKDSSIFVAWATGCEVTRGPINIMELQGEVASFGDPSNALGIAGGNSVDVVSLGDMGQATLTFDVEITDGDGWDFAVFENALDDTFLELAFVQVSSDGLFFHTFPTVSLTDEFVQVPTFGELDCTKLNNFAGKYRQGYGTPFDLSEMAGIAGLNLQKITHIRVIDAIGCIQNQFASFDSQGHVVNDPWPTAFDMGGFDLDAVGVIHTSNTGIEEHGISVSVFPNPFTNRFTVNLDNPQSASIEIFSMDGSLIFQRFVNSSVAFDFSDKQSGVYFLKIRSEMRTTTVRLLKSK